MKRLNLILCTFLLISSCNKNNDEPKVNYVQSNTQIKYRIILSYDTITQYSQYVNNQLTTTKYYHFNGTTDEIISKNSAGVVTGKSVYQIGGNGYAESSVDSIFSDSGTFISISVSTFEYQNGFLIKQTVDTGNYVYTYSISDDNIISSNVSTSQFGCTDNYTYGFFPTTVDVKYFSNKIFGKPSKNLIEHASWSNGCPCGPSSTIASSSFQYEFNSNGYVTTMKNYYIPCYHLGTGNVVGTISTTTYEY
jgi:hypothetical protein